MKDILYGVAYYDEYMPYDRLKEDIALMKKAGINVVRIAESTWSTYEKSPGNFDFSSVTRVIEAMADADIKVIVGTPTYAVPTWLVEQDPTVMVERKGSGRALYGMRQSMDITNKTYLYYAERIIRELMKVSAHYENVIGFQIDNETKAYGTSSRNVQRAFIDYLKEKFAGSLEAMNAAFGLDYWSNRIDSWENFPNVNGTINGSLAAEFEKYQRLLVDDFLQWQADIVAEYKRDDQFITQNFDFDWRGYSYGVQPDVNHTKASNAITLAGCDIYHPSQDQLTGLEIAFCGDSTRNLKKDNYLVVETQAQGFSNMLPYKNQLILQAYSHLASGANGVMYWHWHSIHNSAESYWRGLLSHDFAENKTYQEAVTVGNELKRLSPKLVNLKKDNRVALLVSNESLTALKHFPIDIQSTFTATLGYNEVVRAYYTALYKLNIECDIVSVDSKGWSDYEILVVPALYAAPDHVYQELVAFVKGGGKLLMSFKSGVANENLKISHEGTPKYLQEALGMTYNQFASPTGQTLSSEQFGKGAKVQGFLEFLQPLTADVLATYENCQWYDNVAITANHYGKGKAVYIGCFIEESSFIDIIAKIFTEQFAYHLPKERFPIVVKTGRNDHHKQVTYLLNYSNQEQRLVARKNAVSLRDNVPVLAGQSLSLDPWDLIILEEGV
ncbi:beta-galactosidase [Streptococcus plurextorum]|uniref:beta-galactosidase n=1 Tax=Streptococcus plurextorum TaxID=456876 RepID=UPI00040ADA63|nr:beta-galactosidase [Streptococcus plurextorum]